MLQPKVTLTLNGKMVERVIDIESQEYIEDSLDVGLLSLMQKYLTRQQDSLLMKIKEIMVVLKSVFREDFTDQQLKQYIFKERASASALAMAILLLPFEQMEGGTEEDEKKPKDSQ